jgi:DNA-binding beta-propeller fold protein YncE
MQEFHFPNEFSRMFFEHLSHQQRISIARVCLIWRYLIASFHIPRSYSFAKTIVLQENKVHNVYGFDVDNETGNIVVANKYKHQIQIFDHNGCFLQNFGSYGAADDGQFKYPTDIIINPSNGDIVVTDYANDRVLIFDRFGIFRFKFGKFIACIDVAVDCESNYFITNYEYNQVQVFDERGTQKYIFGSRGNSDGCFNRPRGIAVDNKRGHIIVCDTDNHRMQIFDYQGNFLYKFGSRGTDDGKFIFPTYVAVQEKEGFIAISDQRDNSCIQIFNEVGEFICKFGAQSIENNEFVCYGTVVFDQQMNIYIEDRNKIKIWSPNY